MATVNIPALGKSASTSVNVPFPNVITSKNVETGQVFVLTYIEKMILADLLYNVFLIHAFNLMDLKFVKILYLSMIQIKTC